MTILRDDVLILDAGKEHRGRRRGDHVTKALDRLAISFKFGNPSAYDLVNLIRRLTEGCRVCGSLHAGTHLDDVWLCDSCDRWLKGEILEEYLRNEDIPFLPRSRIHDKHKLVYFARNADGNIKIGMTSDEVTLRQRVKAAQAELLVTELGGRHREGRLHNTFARYRLHGEWFTPGDHLLRYIDRVKLRTK